MKNLVGGAALQNCCGENRKGESNWRVLVKNLENFGYGSRERSCWPWDAADYCCWRWFHCFVWQSMRFRIMMITISEDLPELPWSRNSQNGLPFPVHWIAPERSGMRGREPILLFSLWHWCRQSGENSIISSVQCSSCFYCWRVPWHLPMWSCGKYWAWRSGPAWQHRQWLQWQSLCLFIPHRVASTGITAEFITWECTALDCWCCLWQSAWREQKEELLPGCYLRPRYCFPWSRPEAILSRHCRDSYRCWRFCL